MTAHHFSALRDRSVAPLKTDLEGWLKVEGHPTMKTWIEYTSADKSMISGWWEATPGTYHASYATWEFVHLIEGRIIITPDGGQAHQVNPGDAFVVEPGFKGTWKIEEKALKHFAIRLK